MRFRVFSLGVVFLTSVASAEPIQSEAESVDIDQTAEIIGGTATTVGQYPTVVALTAGGGICTGTLVAKDWVLTAAHCISPGVLGLPNQQAVTDSVRVYFSTININTTAGRANSRRASMTIPKSSFSINNLGQNDVGLIKLSTPIDSITPSPVNFEAMMAPVGTVVTMVGFGSTAQGGGGTVGVQFALQSRTSTSCSGFGLSNTNLLCFNQLDNKGKCQGDSGGPSFAMINNKLTVVGITSFGDQDCAMFGADTRTDIEKTFILANAPELEAKCTMASECPMGQTCFNSQCITEPFQGGGLGVTCTSNAMCESGICGSGPGGMKCTMTCTPGSEGACPDGLECLKVGDTGAGACWPGGDDDSGCCDASGNGAPTGLLGFGLFALIFLRKRRR